MKVPDKNVNIEFSLDNFFNVYNEYFGNQLINFKESAYEKDCSVFI